MEQNNSKLQSRRSLFLGASAVGIGAVGVVASGAFSGASQADSGSGAHAQPKPAPENGGGYTLSAHVKKYYKTTLV